MSHRGDYPEKMVQTTVYMTPEQQAALRKLNERTRVPIAEYLREGIEMVLAKHREDQEPAPFGLSDGEDRELRRKEHDK